MYDCRRNAFETLFPHNVFVSVKHGIIIIISIIRVHVEFELYAAQIKLVLCIVCYNIVQQWYPFFFRSSLPKKKKTKKMYRVSCVQIKYNEKRGSQ